MGSHLYSRDGQRHYFIHSKWRVWKVVFQKDVPRGKQKTVATPKRLNMPYGQIHEFTTALLFRPSGVGVGDLQGHVGMAIYASYQTEGLKNVCLLIAFVWKVYFAYGNA